MDLKYHVTNVDIRNKKKVEFANYHFDTSILDALSA